jgi:TRAP-type C4-dicarboxylate transport system permease large subunit
MIIILMELAMITPPVGINLYVVQGLRKRGKIDDVIIGTAPFVITMLLMLLILSIWPAITLWLPQMAATAP